MKNKKKNIIIKNIYSFIFMTIGTLLAAFSLEVLLVPNSILDGGITGISVMTSYLLKIKLSFLIILLNIPFLIIGMKHLGKTFLYKTTYCMIVYSVSLHFFENMKEVTNDMLLATIFGGLLLGVGVGFVIRYGGCLDGTEILGILISKKTSLSVGQTVLLCNIIIFSMSGLLFGWDRAMYSLLTYFITFKLIDIVAEGFEQAKAVMIITENGNNIANNIYKTLGRTVTTLSAEGLISGEKIILYCVVTRMELSELKKIIENEDNSAFVTVTDVSEIIGNHIKKIDKKYTENVNNKLS